MIRIQQLKLSITEGEENLKKKLAKKLRIGIEEIGEPIIVKKSIDARKKPELYIVYTVDVNIKNEEKILKRCRDKDVFSVRPVSYQFPCSAPENCDDSPVIIGMGPAGLFCGYMLAKHGFKPILFERGKPVEERTKDVEKFWKEGKLCLSSNVQFGEGGAGTFSDGKLNTLIKDKTGKNKEVLKIFVENGAPEQILYDSKPHIGTDILVKTVQNMRNRMLQWGAQIHYESCVTDFIIEDGKVIGLTINDKEQIKTNTVILAIGHSARDTFETLYKRKVPMEPKAFAVGFRVQHPQEMIDEDQYGRKAGNQLPVASYKLSAKSTNGRGVYSFCMCPGGYVVNASSEEKHLAINGMSYSKRNSGVANSAIIISVTPKDYSTENPLAGIAYQRELEENAYRLANGKIPLQYYGDFSGKPGKMVRIKKAFAPCLKGEGTFVNLHGIMPKELDDAFIEGMEQFGKIIPGFDDDFTIIAGVESRTSSPIRITRNTCYQSEVKGIYPCGEGAGYAGGITSAAMDGITVAEAVASKYNTLE